MLGDRRQFGNVKTTNASKEINTSYFRRVMDALEEEENGLISPILQVKARSLNISNSVLDFMENMSNFNIMLKNIFVVTLK